MRPSDLEVHCHDAIELDERLDELLSPSPPSTKLFTNLSESLSPLLSTDQAVIMPGFYLSNSPKFEQWLTNERNRLQQKIESGMQRLVQAWLNSGEYQVALPYAQRLAELDPYNESAQSMLMEILWRLGQRNDALRHYKSFASLLAEELDILV